MPHAALCGLRLPSRGKACRKDVRMKARPSVVKAPAASLRKQPRNVNRPPTAQGSPGGSETQDVALPHERDESTGSASAVPDPPIERAYADLQEGQVDTDLRATPGLDARRRRMLLGRRR
jgi:hypothetical protein